jgi:hypothetical protein
MTDAKQSLADRVADCREANPGLSPAVVDALRLAEMFDDVKPEEFFLPASETLGAFRPLDQNRMLVRAG